MEVKKQFTVADSVFGYLADRGQDKESNKRSTSANPRPIVKNENVDKMATPSTIVDQYKDKSRDEAAVALQRKLEKNVQFLTDKNEDHQRSGSPLRDFNRNNSISAFQNTQDLSNNSGLNLALDLNQPMNYRNDQPPRIMQ